MCHAHIHHDWLPREVQVEVPAVCLRHTVDFAVCLEVPIRVRLMAMVSAGGSFGRFVVMLECVCLPWRSWASVAFSVLTHAAVVVLW